MILFLFCYLFLDIRCLLLLLFSHHRFLLLPRTSKTYAIGQQEEFPITYSAVAITTTNSKKLFVQFELLECVKNVDRHTYHQYVEMDEV